MGCCFSQSRDSVAPVAVCDVPIDVAFEFFSDYANAKDWHPEANFLYKFGAIRKDQKSPLGVGSTWKIDLRFSARCGNDASKAGYTRIYDMIHPITCRS